MSDGPKQSRAMALIVMAREVLGERASDPYDDRAACMIAPEDRDECQEALVEVWQRHIGEMEVCFTKGRFNAIYRIGRNLLADIIDVLIAKTMSDPLHRVLDTRITNTFEARGVVTLSDLVRDFTYEKLIAVPYFGESGVAKINKVLIPLGHEFKPATRDEAENTSTSDDSPNMG